MSAAQSAARRITISKENYLKTIAEAEAEGEEVIAATLKRWLGVTAPAVAMAVRRLSRDGLLRVARGGRIALTAEGRAIANRLLYRHYLIERMLTETFGMPWYLVHDEAEQLEHAVSADFERLLREKLGDDRACPHGHGVALETPADRRRRGLLPLTELSGRGTVECVYERDRDLLIYLDGFGVRPGARVAMIERHYDDTSVVEIGRRKCPLGRKATDRVWVRPE